MLVLLPPSETKAIGGDGAPLDLDRLALPELNPVRAKLVDALVDLAADVPTSLAVLGLSERQEAEVRRNAELRTAPTLPALDRYTGVLYDNLDLKTLTKAERARAERRLAVASALFGVVHGGDPIPAYRLSGGSVLPATGPLLKRFLTDPTRSAVWVLPGVFNSVSLAVTVNGAPLNAWITPLICQSWMMVFTSVLRLPSLCHGSW